MGLPASGNRVTATGISFYTVVDSKITEHWEQIRRHGADGATRSESEPVSSSAYYTCEDGRSRRSYQTSQAILG